MILDMQDTPSIHVVALFYLYIILNINIIKEPKITLLDIWISLTDNEL